MDHILTLDICHKQFLEIIQYSFKIEQVKVKLYQCKKSKFNLKRTCKEQMEKFIQKREI